MRPRFRLLQMYYSKNYSNESWNCPTANLPLPQQQILTESFYKQNGFEATKAYLSHYKSLSNQIQLSNLYLQHAQIPQFFNTFETLCKTWFPITPEIHFLLLQTCFTSLINQARSLALIDEEDPYIKVITHLHQHLFVTTQCYNTGFTYPNLYEISCIVYAQINLLAKSLNRFDRYCSRAPPSDDSLDFLLQKLSLVPYRYRLGREGFENLPVGNIGFLIEDLFARFGGRPTLRGYVSMVRYFSAYKRNPVKALEYYERGCSDYGVDKLFHVKQVLMDGRQGKAMKEDYKWGDRWVMWDEFVRKRPGWSLIKDEVYDRIV